MKREELQKEVDLIQERISNSCCGGTPEDRARLEDLLTWLKFPNEYNVTD